jgi:hypothetical protein
MAREATHRVCEDYRRLNIGALARDGLFDGSGTFTWPDGSHVAVNGYEDSIVLTYAINGEKTQERVSISKTAVHLGGHRSWFLCPGCSRRIAALYISQRFRCRHCHGLRYRSQRESPRFRAISRIQKVRKKLGKSASPTEQAPSRPRYMHHRTYQWLIREEEAAWKAYAST